MSKRAKRNEFKIPEKCAILPEESAKPPAEPNDSASSLPQSRVKETKVEKRKEFSGSDEPAHWQKILDIWFL
ncbi:hypothetical protein, partial [Escherichia coli]|uniref:hypothetical protein n=1 Tax=Escherichia coli TaxID=562 RepID=UPI003D00F353